MAETPAPKKRRNARLAREGFALFVCEDGEWTLAKLYGKRRQDRATGDARLSLVSTHVVAVRLIEQYIEPQSSQLRSKLLLDIVKPGETPPPPPDLALPELALNSARSGAGQARAPGAYDNLHSARGKSPFAAGELGRSMTLGMRLMIIGIIGAIAGIAGPVVMFAHSQDHGGDGATTGILLTAGGIFLACLAAVCFAAARAKAEQPVNEWWRGPTIPDPFPEPAKESGPDLIAARRASLLQFLYGCFTDPRYGQFLQLAKGDAARRHAIRLFVVGAAQACITSLPKPVRPKLTEMIDEALAVPGGDLRERQEFIDDLQKHCLAEKSAPLLREGREAMTNYLGNGRIDIQWLPSTLEAWVKPDPVEMPPPAEPEEHKPQPVAIMFTDIVPPVTTGSDFDAEMAKLAEQHDFTVGMAVKMHFGHQVQQSGSGMMAVFPRICDAVAAAAAIQREITDRNELGFGPGLPLRIGIAAGNSDPKDTGQFASVVETAARLCATASAGQAVLPAWLADMTGCEGFVFSEPFVPAAKVLPDQQRARLLIGTPAPAPVMADAKDIPEHSSSPMPVLERSASPAPAAE